jgi:flavin reductase (DIM6/NTAB) family NADH-FMN oxidoreductase RutF
MNVARVQRIDEPMTPHSFVPGPGTERLFRDALGAFATGVTIVTARSALGPLGMTANSFASLSLDPPLVLWAPARASKRFEALSGARRFAIHVLAADQRDLALHFARQGHDFDLPGMDETAHGVPLIPGCLSVFDCVREAVHEGGDHAIVVGRVLAVQHRPGAPLVFNAGRFGAFDPLEP